MEEADSKKLLPELDREFLDEKEFSYEVAQIGGEVHLVIRGFEFPESYVPRAADLLIILPPGYPNANPDMFWTCPDVKLKSGAWPQASEHHQIHGNRNWQRWSRHFPSWRAGVDGLRMYIASIRRELAKGI